MKKIRISAVSYANTYPFLLGIEKYLNRGDFELSCDVPAVCAQKLITDEVDLGLIPVAGIPLIPDPQIITDYCIGSVGTVKTVLLMSKVPLEDITTVYLDKESRTSVNLIKVLAEKLWCKSWDYKELPSDFEQNQQITSMVLIGDKTQKVSTFPYQYDLSEAWFELTQKPFVFATWVTNKTLPEDFIKDFNLALQKGLEHIPEAIQKYNPGLDYNLEEYLKTYISYPFDKSKKVALDLFLGYLEELG